NGTGGFSGDGGAATSSEIFRPYGLFFDTSGNLLICDQYNQRIRKVNVASVITTIAGNGIPGYLGNGGPATAAEFTYPQLFCLDDIGNIYIADRDNHCIRKVDTA